MLTREQELDDGIEFDPRRDISGRDWEVMKKKLLNPDQFWDDVDFAQMISRVAFLFPERTRVLDHAREMVGEVWLYLTRRVENLRRDPVVEESMTDFEWDDPWEWQERQHEIIVATLIDVAWTIVLLFPQRRHELNLDTRFYKKMEGEVRQDSDRSKLVLVAILFPEHRKELEPNEQEWKDMLNELRALRDGGWWLDFIDMAVNLALLSPDRKDQLQLDAPAWKKMKKTLEHFRREQDWLGYSRTASNLTILAAEDARITSDGQIQITPKKPKLAVESPPLPARPR